MGFHVDVKTKECGASDFTEKILVGSVESINTFEVHWGEGTRIADMIYRDV